MKIVTQAQMRSLEAAAFASGISEADLQERAGARVAEEVARLLAPTDRVVVLVGHGNNGRDGAVAARQLAHQGVRVDLFLGPRHAVRPEELDVLRGLGARAQGMDLVAELAVALRGARVAVDALVGIGARGALREPLAAAAQTLNEVARARGPALAVVAVDIPSGMDADSGAVPGTAVWADHTVALGAVKSGLLRFPAAERAGTLVPADIGLPASAAATLPYDLLDETALAGTLPPRPLDAHKYRFGRVLAVAGSAQYLGAAVLCVGAAARAGAGLVSAACPPQARPALASRVPEAVFAPVDLGPDLDPARAAASLLPLLEAGATLLIGPGLGRHEPAIQLVRALVAARASLASSAGLVVDGDGLFALAQWPGWWEQLGPNAVLTPHAGELARLVEADPAGPPPDGAPWEAAAALAARWSCVLVAKGPFTSVARPTGQAQVWGWANPALATAGSGDVLAGLCAGLLAQGRGAWDAARLAVGVHAGAARALQTRRGWRTLLASDLLDEIPAELARIARTAGPPFARGTP